MPLPPKDDPRRPLFLAVRSMRLLGIVLTFTAALCALPLFTLPPGSPRRTFLVSGLPYYLVPGLVFLLLAFFVSRRKAWAIAAGVTIAYLLIVLSFLALMGALFSVGDAPRIGMIEVIVSLLLLAAFLQLGNHLSRARSVLTYQASDENRGFEVTPVPPLAPPHSIDSLRGK